MLFDAQGKRHGLTAAVNQHSIYSILGGRQPTVVLRLALHSPSSPPFVSLIIWIAIITCWLVSVRRGKITESAGGFHLTGWKTHGESFPRRNGVMLPISTIDAFSGWHSASSGKCKNSASKLRSGNATHTRDE